MSDQTVYSERILGTKANYDWSVRFDKTRGYLRIAQDQDDKIVSVLLSPRQVREMLAFLGAERGR